MGTDLNMPSYRLPARLVHIGEVVPSLRTHTPKARTGSRQHWELLLLQRGRQRMQVADQDILLQTGQALLAPPEAFRRTDVSLSGDVLLYVCVWRGWSPITEVHIIDDPLGRMLRCCRQMLDLQLSEQAIQRDLLLNLMLQIVVDTMQERNEADQAMAWLRDYIERKHAAALDMPFLAKHVGLCPHQMSRRFKAAYGCTPHKFLQNTRLQHAENLIHEGRLTLTEAARRTGFNSGRYLGRLLRQRRGELADK